MNNILSTISLIYRALLAGRRKGYSTEMLKIAQSREDVIIICPTEASAKRFEGKAISMYNLEHYLDGRNDKLFLIDNHTLLDLLKDAADKMQDDEAHISRTHDLIRRMDGLIDNFKRSNRRYNKTT